METLKESSLLKTLKLKVMNGQICRFWPFGAVENNGALLSGRLGGSASYRAP